MKKNIIILLIVVLVQSLSAQNDIVKVKKIEKKAWIDLQLMQHIGLNQWGDGYLHDGLPQAAITEIKTSFNLYMARPYFGTFVDMGLGFMPAPKMRSLTLDKLPMPHSGTKYYVREITSESGNTGTTTHFMMTFGLFGKIPANEKFSVMPYFGVGFLTMPQRKYSIILKEHGTNMQYHAVYVWNCKSGNENGYDGATQPAYLTARLHFKYKLPQKSSLFVGLEYTWFLSTLDFYGRFTNIFNANVQRNFTVKGEKMNMLGISVGLSF